MHARGLHREELSCPGSARRPWRDVFATLTREPLKAAKQRLVSAFECAYVEEKLNEHGGSIAAAARSSGKHRREFFELMRRYGISSR